MKTPISLGPGVVIREARPGADTDAAAALLDRLILAARSWHARVLRLNTVRFMADAQRIYRSRGFV